MHFFISHEFFAYLLLLALLYTFISTNTSDKACFIVYHFYLHVATFCDLLVFVCEWHAFSHVTASFDWFS